MKWWTHHLAGQVSLIPKVFDFHYKFLSTDSFYEKKYSHIEFDLTSRELRSRVTWWGYGVPSLNKLTVFNQKPVENVKINGEPCLKTCQYTYSQSKVLEIDVILQLDTPFSVTWSSKENGGTNGWLWVSMTDTMCYMSSPICPIGVYNDRN